MERPTSQDLATTIRTLDWLAAIAEEQGHEIAHDLVAARAFTAATLAHSGQ